MTSRPIRFIAPMPRLSADGQAWAQEVRRIEDLGFHAVGVSEHFTHGWAMDALTAMNFALAATSRLRALPLVLTNDLHHPALLAKAVATAGALSGGRAGVGIGAGWLADDYLALGVAFEPAAARVGRLAEALRVITAFFADESVTFDGRHYQLRELEAVPRLAVGDRPPVLVAGGGQKMLSLAGRYADIAGLHTRLRPSGFDPDAAGEFTRASVERKIAVVTTAAASAGRPRPDLQFTCYDVNVGGTQVTPARPLFSDYIAAHPGSFAGSPVSLRGDAAQCADDLVRWNEELGISYWNLGGEISALAPVVARLSAE